MIDALVEIALLSLAVTTFAVIVYLVSRSAMAGVAVAFTAFVLFEVTPRPLAGDIVVGFGNISVYPGDVATLALLAVGVWRLFSLDIAGPPKIALMTLVVFVVGHLVWGIDQFGLEQAANHSRLWLPIASGIVYAATVRNWDRRLPSAFVAAGCFLAVLSIVAILRYGLYGANTFIDEGGDLFDARPVISMGVLVMLEALILLLARGKFTFVTAALALLLASGIVLLQYRTVWVTAVACAALGGFYLTMRYRRSNERVVYLLTALALILIPTSLAAASQVSAYQESAETATGVSSTLTWRIGAWKALLGDHSAPADLVLGTPSGTGREIAVNGLETDLSAHNLYVETLLSYGLLGLFVLFALASLALTFREETARQLEIAAPAVVVLVVCQTLVSMTHTPDQVQGLLFGSLLSAACFRTRASAPARVSNPELGGIATSQ